MNKICTTIKQSKKLLKLGIDVKTADMYYMYRHWEIDENTIGDQSDASIGFDLDSYLGKDNGKTYHYIPAWSLSALLSVIPNYKLSSEHNYHTCTAETSFGKETVAWFDNPIDACYEMIIELKEKGLL